MRQQLGVRRRLIISAWCLVIGAAINVLVATAVTLWTPAWNGMVKVPTSTAAARWTRDTGPPDEVFANRLFGQTGYQIQGSELPPNEIEEWVTNVHTAGWPMRSFESWVTYWEVDRRTEWYGGVAIPDWLRPRWMMTIWGQNATFSSRFPTRITWFGFVVNTLFYATLIAAMIAGLRVMHHQRRRRRGLCVRCAYELRDLSICPECGRSIAQN